MGLHNELEWMFKTLKKNYRDVEEEIDSEHSQLISKLIEKFEVVNSNSFCKITLSKRIEILRFVNSLMGYDENDVIQYPHNYEPLVFILDQCRRNLALLEYHQQELQEFSEKWNDFIKKNNLETNVNLTINDSDSDDFYPEDIAREVIKNKKAVDVIFRNIPSVTTALLVIDLANLLLSNPEAKEDIKALTRKINTYRAFDDKRNRFEESLNPEGQVSAFTSVISLVKKRILDIVNDKLRHKGVDLKELNAMLEPRDLSVLIDNSLNIEKAKTLIYSEKDESFLEHLQKLTTDLSKERVEATRRHKVKAPVSIFSKLSIKKAGNEEKPNQAENLTP